MTQLDECPVCHLRESRISRQRSGGDSETVSCPRCGSYVISGTMTALLVNDPTLKRRSDLSAWLREHTLAGLPPRELDTHTFDRLVSTLPNYSAAQKQWKLLEALETLSPYAGQKIKLDPRVDMSLAWAVNEEEFIYLLLALERRGWIESARSGRIGHDLRNVSATSARLTPSGWDYLDAHRSHMADKTQAFVAMSFDPELLPIYLEGIRPAIDAAGYSPMRVDREPHLDRIDAKIIAEIRNSRFLVADVTGQRQGVYYEAGFAQGLGLPVVWTVREDDLPHVHFDTRQYKHIVWSAAAELADELAALIRTTIGQGPRRPQENG